MYLILGGVALAPEVANGGIHFIIDPIRLTRFFSDIDAQLGAAYIPIHGNASTAMPACPLASLSGETSCPAPVCSL